MAPVLWPIRAGDTEPQQRFFADGGFFSNDRKARFVAPEIPALRTETSAGRPLRLNTGRIRDQWHTMTRTGISPRLGAASAGAVRRGSSRRRDRDSAWPTTVLRASPPTTGNASSRSWSARGSSAACCSRRSTGARRPHRPRASARWWRPSPIRFPASPRTRRRRRRSRLTNMSSAASCCRERRLQLPPSLVGARRCRRRLRLSVCRQCRSGAVAVVAALRRRRRSCRVPGFWRRRLSRGFVCRRPHRDLPVRRTGARCRRLGCGQAPVRAGRAQRRSAPHAAVGQIERRAWRARARSSAPASASAAPRFATRSQPGRARAAEIGARLKAGTNCGSCIPELKRLIAQANVEGPEPGRIARTAN